VRGTNNESAFSVLAQINDHNKYKFDQAIRVKALDLAKKLDLQGMLSINFLPNAVYKAETCIRATLEAAAQLNFPTDRIMFEVTEAEKVIDNDHLKSIFAEYKKQKFTTAIDDFGAGYSGLNLLADWQPDIIKLDMALTRNLHQDSVRRALVTGIVYVCKELNIKIIAEGIETLDEYQALAKLGVNLFQGYYFARPGFESLPTIPEQVWQSVQI
jgi:EAL domain-containing protein (putative c-di-GMP-specific phosphodiesterase class I)